MIEENFGNGDQTIGKEFHFLHQVIDLLLLLGVVAHLQSLALALVAYGENLLQMTHDHIIGRPMLVSNDWVIDIEFDVFCLAHDKSSGVS